MPGRAPPSGWAGTHTGQWDTQRSRWFGRATCRTCLQKSCLVPSAPAAWSHPRAVQSSDTASGARRHTPVAARCPRPAGSNWPCSAGIVSTPGACIAINILRI